MGKLHRMTDGELPGVLALLAAGGGTARTAETWGHDRMTALVLGEEGSGVAVMPLARREIQAAAGRVVQAGWVSSNQFASRMGLRGQTRGTAPEWAELLPEVDALVVMRRDEASLGARWYRQTGFEDVLSVRCLYLDMEGPPTTQRGGSGPAYQVQVATPTDPAWKGERERWEAEMVGVYRDVYGGYGGTVGRGAGFWTPALANHYYREHYQFQIIGLWSGANLSGYAVVGWSGWHSKRPRMDILELATKQWDTGVAAELILTTCQLAWSKDVRQVRAVVSAHDPYRGHLTRTGFEDRWGYVMMAKWLQAQRYLDRLSGGKVLPVEMGELGVELVVPGAVPLVLRRGQGGQVIRLQGSGGTVARLMLNRLDVSGALAEGTLVAVRGEGLSEGEVARVALAFPWTPWAFHMLDYI